jgi:hypothetical protein
VIDEVGEDFAAVGGGHYVFAGVGFFQFSKYLYCMISFSLYNT